MLAIFIAAAAAAQTLPHTPKEFRDWMVGCDNRRDCEAVAFADPRDVSSGDPDGLPFLGLVVARRADANAKPKVYVELRFADLEDFTGEIIADGRKTGLRLNKDADLIGDAVLFLALLSRSRSVGLAKEDGSRIAGFRTDGASAALRWMDDRQRRAGTVTALVARGEKPASTVPAPPKIPTVEVPARSSKPARKLSAADIAAVRKRFDLCGERRLDPEYHRLDDANSVAIINCWNGPYQSDGIIVQIPDKGRFRVASIDPPTTSERDASVADRSRLIDPGYDQDSRLLYMAYRGRGPNDCGSTGSWAWDGKAFRLASYAALDVCRGVTARLPYWQTTNDPGLDE